eukprot:scaffold31844_cov112-Isochrysis_galbana.AAC.2
MPFPSPLRILWLSHHADELARGREALEGAPEHRGDQDERKGDADGHERPVEHQVGDRLLEGVGDDGADCFRGAAAKDVDPRLGLELDRVGGHLGKGKRVWKKEWRRTQLTWQTEMWASWRDARRRCPCTCGEKWSRKPGTHGATLCGNRLACAVTKRVSEEGRRGARNPPLWESGDRQAGAAVHKLFKEPMRAGH